MRSLERHCFIHDVVQGGSQPGTLTSFLGPLLKPKSTVVKKKKRKKKGPNYGRASLPCTDSARGCNEV